MNELDAILDWWHAAREGDGDAVLATVVHVQGSAYRRPGARMLILPDGRRVGSISGGCLEGDLTRKAWWLTGSGNAAVRVYDTTSDEDAVWEFGLGCNGVVHVLLERIGSDAGAQLLSFLDARRLSRTEAAVATVIGTSAREGARIGDRLMLRTDGASSGALRASPLARELLPHLRETLCERSNRLVHLGSCDVFLEWIGPPVPLVIFGAGHDAIPLVVVAKQLGWHVTVADGRPAYASSDRFPGVDRVVLLRAEDPLAGVEIGADTVVVVMTHNYPQDAILLRRILPARPRYLGLLGPRRRSERLLAEIGCDAAGAEVHAPVGLDIGAETPASIAVAIVAEIQATLAGREGTKLRLRPGAIHAPVTELGARPTPAPRNLEPVVCSHGL